MDIVKCCRDSIDCGHLLKSECCVRCYHEFLDRASPLSDIDENRLRYSLRSSNSIHKHRHRRHIKCIANSSIVASHKKWTLQSAIALLDNSGYCKRSHLPKCVKETQPREVNSFRHYIEHGYKLVSYK